MSTLTAHASWEETGLKVTSREALEGGDRIRYRVPVSAGWLSGDGRVFMLEYLWMGNPVRSSFSVIARNGDALIVERYERSGMGD